MGLTVHYEVATTCKKRERVKVYLEQARQMAMDLGFEHVSEMVEYENPTDETVHPDHRWMFIQSDTSVEIPWTRTKDGRSSRRVHAEWFAGFTCTPGPGCESLEIVLAQYPRTIKVEYRAADDSRFRLNPKPEDFFAGHQLDWKKFVRWCERHNRTDLDVNAGKVNQSGVPFDPLYNPALLNETRTVKVPGSSKMNVSGFCKTQYASQFGVANFVRCHLSVCHLLRRMESIPTFNVHIDDEGKYETSTYSDDWKEARIEGRKPTYVPHEGRFDVEDLIRECGEWNEMIATMVGGLKDALSGTDMKIEAPITSFADFEHLEARGQSERANEFVRALAIIAKPEVDANTEECI